MALPAGRLTAGRGVAAGDRPPSPADDAGRHRAAPVPAPARRRIAPRRPARAGAAQPAPKPSDAACVPSAASRHASPPSRSRSTPARRAATSYGFDRDVFDVLKRERIPATIFVSGRWVEGASRRDGGAGGAIRSIEFGDHSYDHPHMSHLPVARIVAEIDQTEAALAKYGKRSVAFRPPFGEWSTPSDRRRAGACSCRR